MAANKRFNEMLASMCNDRNAKVYICPLKYSGDQAAMIAYLGMKIFKSEKYSRIEDYDINPRWRVDEIEVNWK